MIMYDYLFLALVNFRHSRLQCRPKAKFVSRTRLRIQHLVEKEKLVLAVEQEILRVHGRAERAVANQVHL